MNICDLNQFTKESIEESMAEKKKPQESTHAGDKVSDMELSEIDEESEGPCPSFSKKRKTERREADEGSTQGDFLKEDITTTVKRLPPLQASGFSSYLSAPIRFPSKPMTDQLKDLHASLLKIWEKKRVSGDIPRAFYGAVHVSCGQFIYIHGGYFQSKEIKDLTSLSTAGRYAKLDPIGEIPAQASHRGWSYEEKIYLRGG